MASYFRQVPNFDYVSRNPGDKYISEYIPVKNLFKRGKLREDIFGDLQFFEKYQIIGDERPDSVAFKFYNDSTLDWVVLLSNNILNIQTEWTMTQDTFDKVMLEKYGTMEEKVKYYKMLGINVDESSISRSDEEAYNVLYNGVHHYETEQIKNSLGVTVLPSGLRLQPTWKTNGNFIEVSNNTILNIASGNAVIPSTTVTVILQDSISSLNLKVGDEVVISNVSESQYNGQFFITKIYTNVTEENAEFSDITAFEYELPFVPNVAQPIMKNPREEKVAFTLMENSGESIQSNSYYYEYWDAGLGYYVQVPSTSFVRPITNYEYENQLQEDKRNIYILKPRYLNVVFNDMDDIMPYKKGSQQYVSETLKRGDNIRLYT